MSSQLLARFLRLVAALGIISSSFAVLSCSHDLTRTEAQRLIVTKVSYPIAITMDFPVGQFNGFYGQVFSHIADGPYRPLFESGMLVMKPKTHVGSQSEYEIIMSNAAMAFAVGKPVAFHPVPSIEIHNQTVRCCEESFGSITGIVASGDRSSAEVEYTSVITGITPFAQPQEAPRCIDGARHQHKACLLYTSPSPRD